MVRRIFDIIPPKENSGKEVKINIRKEIKIEEPKAPPVYYSPKEEEILEEEVIPLKRRKFGFKKILAYSSSILLLAVLIWGFNYYKSMAFVEIKVWPKVESLTLKEEINVSDKAKETNIESKLFLGKIFSGKRSGSEDFPATGKTTREEKAKGIIKIYNNFSESPQVLVAQTRFVSTDGKVFKLLEKTTITGQKYEKGKLVPGTVDAKVQAAEVGEEYNIEPSTFSIPGFAGTSKYTAFYAKSSEKMQGGFKGEALEVSISDIDKAREVLKSKIEKEEKDSLKSKLSSDYILLNDSFSSKVVKESSSALAGTAVSSFNFKEDVLVEGSAFKKSEIDSFVKKIISQKIDKNKVIEESSLKTTYSLKKKEAGFMTLELEIYFKFYSDIDLIALKKAIAGKSFKEIKTLLNSNFELAKIEIKNYTFLNKNVPEDLQKIKIVLSY